MQSIKSMAASRVAGFARTAGSVPLAPGIRSSRAASTATHATKDAGVDAAPFFQPYKLGRFELENRLVYPPLTRCRAPGTVPQPLMAEYYSQRATKGSLMIAEGTVVHRSGHGYPDTPGIYTKEQIDAWKPVTQAVKDKGAVFFCQIWHVGRASCPAYQENGALPVSSSATPFTSEENKMSWTGKEMAPVPTPAALDAAGIKAMVAAFRQGARNALDAGFDGVEIHGANGYLVDQFTKDSVNKRTDEYGGSIENRCRFALEVVKAVADEVGADRVGIRLSPFTSFLDATDSTPYATFSYLVEQLNKHKIAYVHMIEPRLAANMEVTDRPDASLAPFRKISNTAFISAGGHTRETGIQAVANGDADLVSYGRLWLSNPDLPKRFKQNAPLNKYDRSTFYAPGPKGYTDYPFME